jgi:hypothetical protein
VSLDPLLTRARASAEIARLKREGFAGVRLEYLDRGPDPHGGVSWVMQLASRAAARPELNASFAEDRRASKGKASSFAVPGFLYLVGQNWSNRNKKPPTRTALITAVQTLYARVRGR